MENRIGFIVPLSPIESNVPGHKESNVPEHKPVRSATTGYEKGSCSENRSLFYNE